MTNFETAVENVVQAMIAKYDTCIDPYFNGNDFAQIHFMEAGCGNVPNIHALMKEFHAALSEKLGYPPCITHNNTTDEVVHVIGDPISAQVYYSDECCKRNTIKYCIDFLDSDRAGYSEEIRSIAFAAEVLSENLDKTVEYILQTLDWDKDIQAQLIAHLINYHR